MANKLPVKLYRNDYQGAPQITGEWGDLVKVLDACLVNGFNEQDVSSLTASGSVATVTTTTPHGYQVDDVIEISGTNEADFNGEWRVTEVVSATSLTYNMLGTGTTATGTIKIKRPSLGFEKVFGDEKTGAYRSGNIQSSRHFLRVDDRTKGSGYNPLWAKWANVGIVENMVDFDTMLGAQAPFDASSPKKNWEKTSDTVFGWAKWYYALRNGFDGADNTNSVAGNRNWMVVGDDRAFYLFIGTMIGVDFHTCAYFFGDVARDFTIDKSPILVAHLNRMSSYQSSHLTFFDYCAGTLFNTNLSFNQSSIVSVYDINGVQNSTRLYMSTNKPVISNVVMNKDKNININPLNFSYEISPIYLNAMFTYSVFGQLPGMYWSHFSTNGMSSFFSLWNKEKNRKYCFSKVLRDANPNDPTSMSYPAFDITGPWR